MAEVPVKKRARKTTTKKVARKATTSPTVVSKTTPKVTTKAVASAPKQRGLSLKFVLLTILILFLASGGAFYLGYSAEGAIDVNNRIADDARAAGADGQVEGVQNPPPLKERPKLEPAAVETPKPTPEATEVIDTASSTDETVSDDEVTTDDTTTPEEQTTDEPSSSEEEIDTTTDASSE